MSSAIATQELRYAVTGCNQVTITNNAEPAMRARGLSTLGFGLLVVAWLTSCGLKPVEDPPAVSHDACAGPNPLHMVSTSPPKRQLDPEIESLLAQRPVDPRLIRINREMSQSLYALDTEIRREQEIAACKQPPLNDSTLQTRSRAGANHPLDDDGPANTPNPAPGAGLAIRDSFAPSASPLRKSNVSANGAAGNGATAPKIVPGSDDDIVARRLRKAAEAETDPALRAKLWKEYTDYRQGTGVAK